MHTSLLLTMLLGVDPEPHWLQVAHDDGVFVYSREKRGARVRELRSTGLIDAPPETVWRVVRDYQRFSEVMPYTEDAKVVDRTAGDKVVLFYAVTNFPLVSKRDYLIRLVDESAGGVHAVRWTEAEHPDAPERDGYVRVPLTRGAWILEPREGGAKTFLTYELQLDPGGAIPDWVANRANALAVPEVFRAVRAAANARLKLDQGVTTTK